MMLLTATRSEMAENPKDPEKRSDDTTTFRREIDALRTRLQQNADKTKQLSWDTELLVKKTQSFERSNIISTTNPEWKQVLSDLEIGPEGVCIAHVRTVDAIEFIASFAAQRQLTMTYGNRSFLLEPRDLPE